MKKIVLFFVLLIGVPFLASAQSLKGWAWSENVGWIHFRGPGYGVTLNPDTNALSGYAWSEHIGWINFDPNNSLWAIACGAVDDNCIGIPNEAAAPWDGQIKLKDEAGRYGLTVDSENCRLKGWIWGSEVVGWIHLNADDDNYGVKIADCGGDLPDGGNGDGEESQLVNPPVCDFSAAPARVSRSGRSTLTWDCQGTADSCTLAGPNLSLNNQAGLGTALTSPLVKTSQFDLTCEKAGQQAVFSTKVSVVRPFYCEIIPFLGKCRL